MTVVHLQSIPLSSSSKHTLLTFLYMTQMRNSCGSLSLISQPKSAFKGALNHIVVDGMGSTSMMKTGIIVNQQAEIANDNIKGRRCVSTCNGHMCRWVRIDEMLLHCLYKSWRQESIAMHNFEQAHGLAGAIVDFAVSASMIVVL
jgi:hypothetical protein